MSSIFDVIRIPIGYLISFCYKLVPNYAIALLLFALVMKIVLFPLGIKQQKNTIKQAKLRPKEQAIRNHYANGNQQKMNEELMKLYKEENFSPYGGCLPMIIQLVIVFALYQVVLNPLQYISHVSKDRVANINYHICELYNDDETARETITQTASQTALTQIQSTAEKITKYKNGEETKEPALSIQAIETVRIIREVGVDMFKGGEKSMLDDDFTEKDLQNFHLFGDFLDLSRTPSIRDFSIYWLIPLTFAFSFATMKLQKKFMYQPPQSSNGGDAGLSMKIMDFVMPLISGVFAFQVPAVVAVYWIYQSILGLVQQIILKAMYPYPEFTEEDYKAASREMYKSSGSKIDKKERKNSGAISAHRIDLLPDEADETEESGEADGRSAPERNSLVAPAKLKDESDKKRD